MIREWLEKRRERRAEKKRIATEKYWERYEARVRGFLLQIKTLGTGTCPYDLAPNGPKSAEVWERLKKELDVELQARGR